MAIQARQEYDVVVAGGGTAGIVAAIAAARTGARTALVEQNGFVGGVAALGNLPFLSFQNNRNDQIIEGIPLELITRLKKMKAAAEVRNFGVGEPRGKGSLKFNAGAVAFLPEPFKYLALEMLREAGVEILLHTFVSDVMMQGNAVAGLVVENKSGRVLIPAKCVVDCTGDADVAARAGAPFEKGRAGDGQMQPVTPLFTLSNVDLSEAVKGTTTLWPWEAVGLEAAEVPYKFYVVNLERWEEELKRELAECGARVFEFLLLDMGDGVYYCGNMIHLPGLDASDAEDLSRAEVNSRLLVWRLGQFLRKHVTGFANSHVVSTGAQIGVRETRRIVGEYTLDYGDVIEARRFDDVVALCGYRVDVHGYDGGPVYNEPELGTQVKDYGSYDIPYRSLVPQKVENVVVAGRSISATHEAQGSLRVMGTAMAIGHAAGTAAALSAREGVALRNLDAGLLQRTLLAQGAYLGERFAALKVAPPIPQRNPAR